MKISALHQWCLCASLAVLAIGCKPRAESPQTDANSSPARVPRGENHSEGFDADLFHYTDQGSGFFPLSVVRALKDSETGRPYLENLERFGLVPGETSRRNPYGFPVGIVTNRIKVADGEIEMFGFTCAACHTSDLHYKGKVVRVDGGSGLFYVDKLGDQIGNSLKATLNDPEEFLAFLQRFAQESKLKLPILTGLGKLLGSDPNLPLRKALLDHLHARSQQLLADMKSSKETTLSLDDPLREKTIGVIKQVAGGSELLANIEQAITMLRYRLDFLKMRDWLSSDPTHRLTAGYGRADDFGTARVELFGKQNDKNKVPVNAPVSIPPIWNVDKYAWLHWNANTNSVIQRSIGEAIGVGATLNLETDATSVDIVNQIKIEEQVRKLTPPKWPAEIFGQPDTNKVEKGRGIFLANCAGCHAPKQLDEKGLVVFRLSTLEEAGTDPNDATNFDRPVYNSDDSTVSFAAESKDLLTRLQAKAKANMSKEDQDLMDKLEARQTPVKWRDTMKATGGPVYPARPLEGIWATAPYLHNGSVPTLYHLLLPAAQRPKKFPVGQKDFDPVNVGFAIDPAKITPQTALTLFEMDTTLPGNLNTGHEWGTQLPEGDRLALIEYLKVHHDTFPTNEAK